MSKSEEEREENRRIWWTVTSLDLEIGMRGGSPTLIDERILKVTTSLPLERIGRESVCPSVVGPLPVLAVLIVAHRSDPNFLDFTRHANGCQHSTILASGSATSFERFTRSEKTTAKNHKRSRSRLFRTC
jgi:hypothetical protein